MITDLLQQLKLLSIKNPKVLSLAEVAMAAPDPSEDESLQEDLEAIRQALPELMIRTRGVY
jgi:hypothetical protein